MREIPDVIKIGGSVLGDLASYRTAALFLAARAARDAGAPPVVAVVSAQHGHTDALLRDAHALHADPARAPLDLLWSTGEIRSVALLTLALRAAGVDAEALNVHESGVRVDFDRPSDVTLNPIPIRAALARVPVVVVPGFLATARQRIVTLGRGGSDWSAVVLAAALGTTRCELIKDVAGYFTSDPRTHPDATLVPHLTFDDAIAAAERGCPLVQRQALSAAADANLTLVVRSFTSTGTTVTRGSRAGVSRPGAPRTAAPQAATPSTR